MTISVQIVQVRERNEWVSDCDDLILKLKYQLRLMINTLENKDYRNASKSLRRAKRKAKWMIKGYIEDQNKINFKEEMVAVIYQ